MDRPPRSRRRHAAQKLHLDGEDFVGEGDPDWVNIIPPSQYLNRYVLFTDPTYPETNLVVVRTPSKVDQMFADVTLDCGGGADVSARPWRFSLPCATGGRKRSSPAPTP